MATISVKCNICHSDSFPLGKVIVLNKYNVQYYSCENCGFIQTKSPYWLDDAYSSAIARSDIGLISRNVKLAGLCSALIPILNSGKMPFLDYGGGNGMFVRMMRDKGFDFYWCDKYASNQFADGFDAVQDMKFSILTAFEIFEHLPQPLEAIANMFKYSDTVIFSTRLLPYWNINPSDWWYFTLDTGQHVSLYTRKSLEIIAEKFNAKLSSNGISLHLFSAHALPTIFLKAVSFPPFAKVLSHVLNIGRHSLLEQDYYAITGKRLSLIMRILKVHNHYTRSGGEDTVFHAEKALLLSRGHEVIEYLEFQ